MPSQRYSQARITSKILSVIRVLSLHSHFYPAKLR